MDFIYSLLLWPFITFTSYFKFIVGTSIILLPYVIHLLSHGIHSLDSFISLFAFLKSYPFGCDVFSGIASVTAPYSGSISAKVIEFDEKQCVILLFDYPWLRNPFKSIHAIALMNAGELASGICMVEALKKNSHLRGIPTELKMEYFKKSRGTIRCVGTANIDSITTDCKLDVVTNLYDKNNNIVAKATVSWKIEVRAKVSFATSDSNSSSEALVGKKKLK